MIVRYLDKNDIPAHEKLASQAFAVPTEPETAAALPAEIMVGVFEDGVLTADAEAEKKTVFIGGKALTAVAIGGVCSAPVYRGRGHIGRIFGFIEKSLDCDLAVLKPFSPAYYEKLGFGVCGQTIGVSVPFSVLKGFAPYRDAISVSERTDESGFSAYNDLLSAYNLSFARCARQPGRFGENAFGNCRFYYAVRRRDDGGEHKALALVRPERNENTLYVDELLFDGVRSLTDMLGFLRCFEGNFDRLTFSSLPENTPLRHILPFDRGTDIRFSGDISAKIYRYPAVLEAIDYARDGEFTLRIEGGEAYAVCVRNGKAQCKNTRKHPDITLSDDAAAKILLGGVCDKASLDYIPGVSYGAHPEKFFGIIGKRPVYLCEDF